MRVAGLLVARTLEMLRTEVRPGMTTGQLDALAEDFIRSGGGIPNFQLVPGYEHTLCTSVDEEIVHGIPGERVLREGELLSIDCGAEVEGWNGDSAMTVVVNAGTTNCFSSCSRGACNLTAPDSTNTSNSPFGNSIVISSSVAL